MFMDQKVNILKISVLFKVICRFNAISIKCQNLFSKKKKKKEKPILKFMRIDIQSQVSLPL